MTIDTYTELDAVTVAAPNLARSCSSPPCGWSCGA
jgi:hypothetical protein